MRGMKHGENGDVDGNDGPHGEHEYGAQQVECEHFLVCNFGIPQTLPEKERRRKDKRYDAAPEAPGKV